MSHLNDVDMKYFTHFKRSMGFCFKSFEASFYFFIHAFIPDIFEYNGSNTIDNLKKSIDA
jgi:hypothetical protein